MTDLKDSVADGMTLLPVIVGPTGSGKTALSLALAEQMGGEVVSCDSVAVYREMEIGTAKPSFAERERVRHHMIDVVSPDEAYTAGEYGRAARAAVQDIAARGLVPVVAGGTGLYLRALLDGLSPIVQRDETLRKRLRERAARRGTTSLHRVLRRLDPAAAKKIHENDLPKLVRAIEVCALERRPMSSAWSEQRPEPLSGFRVVMIGLAPAREALYARLNRRAAEMFAEGLLEETHTLVSQYGWDCRALTSLGYAQAVSVLRGESTREEAIASAQQGHRNYAKRQGTWFRKDARVQWLQSFGEESVAAALALLA
jgi:tRNA dimethylallyltransferase